MALTENRRDVQRAVISRAKVVLGTAGVRVQMTVGLLICILATVSVVLIVSALSLLVDFDMLYATSAFWGALAETALVLVQFALILLLAAPLYLGLLAAAIKMRRGASVTLADLFAFFDSPSAYFRGWGMIARVVGRAYPYWLLYGLSLMAFLTESEIVYGIIGATAVPLILWGLYTTGRSLPFLTFALCNPQVPLRHTMMNAKAMTKKKTLSIFVFRMRLLWRFLLSLLSIGVVTLLHTLPLLILATHEYAFVLARQQEEALN